MQNELKRISNGSRMEFSIGLLLLVVILFAVFWPSLQSPLAFDDVSSLRFVQSFQSAREIWGRDAFMLFRPVKNLQCYLILQAGGSLPLWHLTNLVGYAAAMTGVAVLIRHFMRSSRWGLAGGAAWAFATTGVTVAVWASCFNISVAVAASAFAVYLHAKNAEQDRGWGFKIAAALCWLLALFSYETAAAVAPLIVLLDWFMKRPVFEKKSLLRYGCFAAVGIVWFVMRVKSGSQFQGMNNNPCILPDMPRWQLTASAPYFLWTHLLMWAAPDGRIEFLSSYIWGVSVPSLIHPFCWFLLAGLVLTIIALKKRAPLAAFGLAWFIVGAIPSGNFIPLGNTPFADYYIPFPSIGLVLAMLVWIRGLWALRKDETLSSRARNAAMGLAIVLVLGRVAQLPTMWKWIELWHDPIIAITEVCPTRPGQFMAKSVIAFSLSQRGDDENAQPFAAEAAAEGPHLAPPHIVMGDYALKQGRTQDAIREFEAAARLMHMDDQTAYYCLLRLGQIYGKDKATYERSMSYLMPVLRKRNFRLHDEAVNAAAESMEIAGKRDLAIETVRKGLTIHTESEDLKKRLERLEATPAPTPP